MIRINLTKDEKYLLKQYFKTSPLRLVRLKAQAVLMRSRNLELDDASEFLFKDKRTIQRWIKDFSKKRMATIFTGHENNENVSAVVIAQLSQRGGYSLCPLRYVLLH